MNVDLLELSLKKKKKDLVKPLSSKFLWHICSPENESLIGSIITVILWVAYSSCLSVGEDILIHIFSKKTDRDVG